MSQSPSFTSFEIRDRTNRCKERFEQCFAHPKLRGEQWLITGRIEFDGWSLGLHASHSDRSSLDHRVRQRPDVKFVITGHLIALDSLLKRCLGAEPMADRNDSAGVLNLYENPERSPDANVWRIKKILRQLTYIHAMIRELGTQLRHHKADISLKSILEENANGLEEFRMDMTKAILAGVESWNREDGLPKPWGNANRNLIARFVNANVKRRNRIFFATEKMRKAMTLQLRQKQEPVMVVDLEETVTKTAIETRSSAGEKTKEPEQKPGEMSKNAESANPLPRQGRLCEGSQVPTAATTIPPDVLIDLAPSSVAGTKITEATGTIFGQSYMYPLPPKWPKESTVPIECPYCSELLTKEYKKQAAWNGHVSGDILPYMCFIEDCKTPDDLYRTSEELTKHVISAHGVPCWICDECTPDTGQDQFEIFETAELWRDHCSHAHSETIPDSIFSKFAESKMRKMVPPIKCPLCDYATSEIKRNIDPEILRHIHQFSNAISLEGLPDAVHEDLQLTDHRQIQYIVLQAFAQIYKDFDDHAALHKLIQNDRLPMGKEILILNRAACELMLPILIRLRFTFGEMFELKHYAKEWQEGQSHQSYLDSDLTENLHIMIDQVALISNMVYEGDKEKTSFIKTKCGTDAYIHQWLDLVDQCVVPGDPDYDLRKKHKEAGLKLQEAKRHPQE
ncbi:hypothetical protein TrVFT333_011037 [Trichoderma virens FT-333]|nr:hypothetical protein TrVFT333_011037 [Trichoderma virens FT-333]